MCVFVFMFQSLYCTDRRGGDKYGLSSSISVLSEMGEVINGVLDSKVSFEKGTGMKMFSIDH